MPIERPVFVPPEWHRGETAEEIQARMMERLPADIDNIEGGFPYDFTMPTALEEDEIMNFVLIETLKIMFPAWSYDRWLDYHAAAVGLTRRPANPASGTVTIQGVPGTAIPAGTVLCVPAVGDVPAIEFATLADATIGEADPDTGVGSVKVDVMAVEPGKGGNVAAGTIVIMSVPVKGITSINNDDPITGGTAEEDDDSLYERIAEREQNDGESFVGNDADYIRWAKEVNGVGTVLVDTQYEVEHPNWVKLIILDANGQPANRQILDAVYTHIMNPDTRSINRLAPIGAVLFVEAPTGCELSIAITGLQLEDGATQDDVIARFESALDDYYVQAKAEGIIFWNEVHAVLTRTAGVHDFSAMTINGSTANITLEAAQYPVTKEVTAT